MGFMKGRKKRPRKTVAHRKRPVHDGRHPVHVTLRVRRDLPNLRSYKVAQIIGRLMRALVGRAGKVRVTHFSIQSNHLHLLVEADDTSALSKGMQGLVSLLARTINGQIGRRGSVFRERYHAHPLKSPTEVRRALVYVLQNVRKHSDEPQTGIDPCSSARWFNGWHGIRPSADPPPVSPARTWLLREGWQRAGGLLRAEEQPKPICAGP